MTAPASASPAQSCAVCGTALVGPYCHGCGQPGPTTPRRLRDALTGQTGKLWYTLRRLLRPGALAHDIDRGRDRLAVRPLTLLLNLIPFGLGGFSAHALIVSDTSGTLASLAARQAEAHGVQPAVYDERLDNRFRSAYSVLITLSALSYGLALWLVERRKGKAWVVHLTAAVQYLCFTFVLSALAFGGARLLHVDLLARLALATA